MANRTKILSDTLAGRIKSQRIKLGYTQKELSELLYKSESAVRMWELGKSEPDVGTIIKISKCLNVSVEYLLGLDNKNELSEPEKVVLEVFSRLSDNDTLDAELTEDVIIYHRDGKTVKRKFTKEQLALFHAMLDAIPDTPTDL